MSGKPSRLRAISSTLVASLLWGTSFVANKEGLEHGLDPYQFSLYRILNVLVLVWLGLVLTGRVQAAAGMFFRGPVVILGLTNALGFIFQYLGQELTSVNHAAFLASSGMPFVALLGFVILKERLNRASLLALGLALLGSFWIAWDAGGPSGPAKGSSWLGDLLVFLSAASWSVFVVLNRRLMKTGVDPICVAGPMFFWTSLTILPFTASLGSLSLPDQWEPNAAIVYTSIFCTLVPYWLWSVGLQTITATVSSILLTVEIVCALFLSWLIRSEVLTPVTALGGGLVVLAAVLASWPPTRFVPVARGERGHP